MPHPDIQRVGQILREVAAEVILPRFRNLGAHEIDAKSGPHDLVTIADREAEVALGARLKALVPGSIVLGEEACTLDPRHFDLLQGADPVWVIDPIDGTLNFANGSPLFGMLLAYVVGGETLAGWIYDPLQDRLATVERGSGGWIAGRRLNIKPAGSLGAMHGSFSLRSGHGGLAAGMDRLGSLLMMRCAAQEYLALAEGILHFVFYRRVLPWDHAAGVLLVSEAGGHGARLDGVRYRPGDPHEGSPILVAASESDWHLIKRELLSA